jgi:hypothetical protein
MHCVVIHTVKQCLYRRVIPNSNSTGHNKENVILAVILNMKILKTYCKE